MDTFMNQSVNIPQRDVQEEFDPERFAYQEKILESHILIVEIVPSNSIRLRERSICKKPAGFIYVSCQIYTYWFIHHQYIYHQTHRLTHKQTRNRIQTDEQVKGEGNVQTLVHVVLLKPPRGSHIIFHESGRKTLEGVKSQVEKNITIEQSAVYFNLLGLRVRIPDQYKSASRCLLLAGRMLISLWDLASPPPSPPKTTAGL